MSISSIPPSPPPRPPESAEPKGPDLKNDGDADDGPRAATRATPPPGVGTVVDTTA